MKAEKKKTAWQSTRKFFMDLHLWMGLASGLIVIAICFSGTVYVFNSEVKEMASPEMYRVVPTAGSTMLSPDEIIEKVEATTRGKVVSIKTYSDPTHAWQIGVKKLEVENRENTVEANNTGKSTRSGKENAGNVEGRQPGTGGPPQDRGGANGGSRPDMYMVDPYTGEIKGDAMAKNGAAEFMGTMFSLHRWLLLDKIEAPIIGELPNRKLGSYITGTATILFTLGLLTGLVIWFPQKVKSWKQGLKIKWDASWKRINHDLHNTLAFYSFIFLLVMGITGPQWSFPWYREGLQKSLGTYQPQDAPRPKAPTSTLPVVNEAGKVQALKITEYIAAADRALPYTGNYTIALAADSSAAISISKNRIGFFAPAAGDKLMLDQYTAEILTVDIFRDKPFNQRLASSIKALHVGDVYGTFTKMLYFIACLIATTLPVTGTIIWINKLRKRNKGAKADKPSSKEKVKKEREILNDVPNTVGS